MLSCSLRAPFQKQVYLCVVFVLGEVETVYFYLILVGVALFSIFTHGNLLFIYLVFRRIFTEDEEEVRDFRNNKMWQGLTHPPARPHSHRLIVKIYWRTSLKRWRESLVSKPMGR